MGRLDTGLLAGLAALQVGDIITTRYIVDHGGREFNPVMADVVEHPLVFLGAKGLLVVAAACTVGYARKHNLSWVSRLSLLGLVGYYSLVVGHNLYQIAGEMSRCP